MAVLWPSILRKAHFMYLCNITGDDESNLNTCRLQCPYPDTFLLRGRRAHGCCPNRPSNEIASPFGSANSRSLHSTQAHSRVTWTLCFPPSVSPLRSPSDLLVKSKCLPSVWGRPSGPPATMTMASSRSLPRELLLPTPPSPCEADLMMQHTLAVSHPKPPTAPRAHK